MASIQDVLTASSSTLIRVFSYIFLRWIPGHHFPPLIFGLAAVYAYSFYQSFVSTSPFEVISDEIDIISRETVAQGLDSDDEQEPELEELDVSERVVLGEKGSYWWQSLLSGLPSPTWASISLATAGINLALVLMTADLVYRGPALWDVKDLSFARVGYVSDHSAKILIREPDSSQLPIWVSYRYADPPLAIESGYGLPDTAWKSAGSIPPGVLNDETDYTTSTTLLKLRPDTRYQYALSNNHTGYFITAPPIGKVSKRNDGKYTFVHSSCIKPHFPYNPLHHPLSVSGFNHLAEWIPKLKAHFMVFLGDFIYIDVPRRFGYDPETYRAEYRRVYASPDWPSVSNDLPWIHVLDDHEIANDWDKNTTGIYAAAADPWELYHVAANPPPAKPGHSWFTFTQGPASFFLMDTRRYRTPETSDPNETTKSMLGPDQLSDLIKFLQSPLPAGVEWKIIISSVPFTKNWRFGGQDTWGGYLVERQVILENMWQAGSKGIGVVVLSGDRHEFAATAFPPPPGSAYPGSATVYEFSTSPLSMFYLPVRTYRQVDDEDVVIKYIPDGQSKFGAVEIEQADGGKLHYRLFVDGVEVWTHTITRPPVAKGGLFDGSYM